jgi:hypothetical protein
VRIKHPVLGILALFWIFNPVAAQAQVEDDSGLWLALFAQDDLRGKDCRWKWWLDSHLRFLDDADGLNQSIVRPGVGWKMSDKMTGWAGYAWIHNRTLLGAEFEEHRAWQQLTWSTSSESWSLLLRPRLEQRFVETGDDVGLRFRQFIRLQRQIPTLPRLSLVSWDELFFHCNDTDWGARSGFDQNRVFVGLGIKSQPGSRLRTEIGYLNQSIDNASNPNRSHHNLAINFFY